VTDPQPSLALAFAQALEDPRRRGLVAPQDLEPLLASIVRRVQARWPGVKVDAAAFEIYERAFTLLEHAVALKDKRCFEESLRPLLAAQRGFAPLAVAGIAEGARMEGFALIEDAAAELRRALALYEALGDAEMAKQQKAKLDAVVAKLGG